MGEQAHFSVNTRLTRLLGETYRSSEVALKELVDNAWDADATSVLITLPAPMTREAVVISDDGSGMTEQEIRNEYLNIASDKRTRTGERTVKFNRKIKGRKGIGKFAGLTIAGQMTIQSIARDRKSFLVIDKNELIENENDLEAFPLPFNSEPASPDEHGTTIILTELDDRLNFPTPDRLREVLIHEYGREDSFRVFVNGTALSIEDAPGTTTMVSQNLQEAGTVNLHFTIANGSKLPKSPGIIVRVDGKTVGKPTFFGLDEDDEIPLKLTKKLFGVLDLDGMEDHVTADWGSMIENSKGYQEARAYVHSTVKESLQSTYSRDMNLQRARLQKQLNARLQRLPEFRRQYAEEALNRIFKRFYGESEDRIATIAEVALDAMEQDIYWVVLDRINIASHGDVGSFAASLEQFGLLELSTIGSQARSRREFLDYLDKLIDTDRTLEKEMHQALERSLWVFGRSYSTMASNSTLRNIVEKYSSLSFKGDRASKRPDLLLCQDYGDSYLLLEFKRPSHPITRDDIAQAEKYRDDLSPHLNSTSKIEILMVGKGRLPTVNAQHIANSISIHSYASVISSARREIDWLIESLSR